MSEHTHSGNAERSVLGACLLRAGVFEGVRLGPDDFFDPRHRAIWVAMTEAVGMGGSANDIVDIEAALSRAEKLDAVGGLAYLSELAISVLTPDNVQHYATVIRDKTLGRHALMALSDAAQSIERQALDGQAAIDAVESAASSLRQYRARRRGASLAVLGQEAARKIWTEMSAREKGQHPPSRIPSGLLTLDAKIGGGYGRGSWTVLVARPGCSKTSFIAQSCRRAPVPAALFLFEEPDDFIFREFSAATGIPSVEIAGQRLNAKQLNAVSEVGRKLRHDVHIVDARGMGAVDIARDSRALVAEHGVELVGVDYLNRMRHPRADRYDLSIRATLDILDDMIGELGVAGLLGAQLRRPNEKETRLPRLSDARDAGAIEEIAKLGLVLHRPYMDRKKTDGGDNELWVIIDKQNLGPRRQPIRFDWDGPRLTISDRSAPEDEDRQTTIEDTDGTPF